MKARVIMVLVAMLAGSGLAQAAIHHDCDTDPNLHNIIHTVDEQNGNGCGLNHYPSHYTCEHYVEGLGQMDWSVFSWCDEIECQAHGYIRCAGGVKKEVGTSANPWVCPIGKFRAAPSQWTCGDPGEPGYFVVNCSNA